jgi:Domain of unknown function (DUF4142)
MAQGSFAPITDRDPAPLDRPINALYAKGGDDSKLKDWAAKTLPALRHHLEMA